MSWRLSSARFDQSLIDRMICTAVARADGCIVAMRSIERMFRFPMSSKRITFVALGRDEMTLEELDANYKAGSWLIAKRSAVAAGKALIFTAENLDDAAREIASIYELGEQEIAQLRPAAGQGALESVQSTTNTLFADTLGLSDGQALSVAKKALVSGRKAAFLRKLISAGPNAAKALLGGTKAAGHAGGKGTPWGWIATAVYAAGTGSWFAWNLRTFNLAAYEFVRLRDGIELPPDRLDDRGFVSLETLDPLVSTISEGLDVVGARADTAWQGAKAKGGHVADAARGALSSFAARWRTRSGS